MSRLRQLKRQTRDLLDDLGDSPDRVAAALRGAGVHGVPRDNRSCALAMYLSSQMGGETEVRAIAVGHCSMLITLVNPRNRRPAGRLRIQLSKPVRQFVASFDAMAYPDIVRPVVDKETVRSSSSGRGSGAVHDGRAPTVAS